MQRVQKREFHAGNSAEVTGHIYSWMHEVKWAFEEIPGNHKYRGLPPVMTDFNRWQGDIEQSDDGEHDNPEPNVSEWHERSDLKPF